MRHKWLVLLIAIVAVLGVSLPALASQQSPGVLNPMDFGSGSGGPFPTNGDDDEEDDEEVDEDEDEEDADDEEDEEDEDAEDDVDDDEDEEDEDDFEEEEREVNVVTTDDEVTIELESTSEEREDEVKVQFEAPEGEMKVSFEREGSGEEEVEMRIEFREIVEFEDSDADGAFSPLNDDVLQEIRVETLAHSAPEVAPFTVDSSTGQRISVVYALPGGSDGTFELVFWVFGLVTEIDGIPVRPTEVKIDIIVTDFPFTATTSLLALGLDVRTEFELEGDEDLSFDQINAVGEEFSAFFRWMPDAVTVDGTAASAEVTTVEERKAVEVDAEEGEFEKELRLFLAYPQGSVIVHDPKVGIVTAAVIPEILPPVGSITAYVVGLGTALLLVLGVWGLNRRRR